VPPLNIALIVNLYPPYIVGGNEILARDVACALRERGHMVHVLTGRGRDLPTDGFTHGVLDIDLERKEDTFLGGLPLTIGRVVRWHLFNRASYRGVRFALERLQPDLTIAWNLYMASAAPLIAARRFSAPVVAHPADKWLLYSLNNLTALVPGSTTTSRFAMRQLQRWVQPVLRRRARPDYILAVSEFIRGLHTRAGYPASQSLATHLGVHTATFARKTHRFPGSSPKGRPWRLIFTSQLWWGKGPQVAVEAVRLLRQRRDLPDVTLDIYGSGTDHFVGHLSRLIDQAGLSRAVRLHGFVPQRELAAAYYSHDLNLFCSIWDEPFSGGLLEAMATGIPTIATTAGGTPEAVVHERNGLLVPPDDAQALADAAARLMTDPALYERVGDQAGQDVRSRWSFDGYIDRLENVYTRIVQGHRRGKPMDLRSG
jgi:glycosyltransferase involved in cell wall biosynthesis